MLDPLQDAQLLVKGVASSQFISLYRYYKSLTTPDGEQVQYTADEVTLLHRLNDPIPFLPTVGTLTNAALDLQLATDRGLGILQPGEALTVTGHSLGGHLALLFGRAFPVVAENIYTFNAPGISAWGNVLLNSAGLLPNDPARVVNVVSDFGEDFIAAYGTRPGPTHRIFIEEGGPRQNHAIAQLSDSLAIYDLLAKLSPGLAEQMDAVSAILAAASRVPAESLEKTLDMLGHALGGDESVTPIATTAQDQAQRDAYYAKLYDLRDRLADGHDWGISPLAGMTAESLRVAAATGVAYRHALADLLPFVATGASFDDPLDSLSERWLAARADFLSNLLEARTVDRPFLSAESPRSSLFVDVARGEQVALLNASLLAQVEASDVPLTPASLASLAYDEKTLFGADDAADTLQGSAGIDYLFGGGGGDALAGLSGGDFLEGGEGDDSLEGGDGDDELAGGAGADLLTGGDGYDSYVAGDGDLDRIVDADGRGEVRIGADVLTGGHQHEDDRYVSADGRHVYELAGGTLTVDGTLRIEQFVDGSLGIRLTEQPHPVFEATYVYAGERELRVGDGFDEYGNNLALGPPTPGTFDGFIGRPGSVLFDTGAGNDYVSVGFDGNNKLLLGSGDDFGFGGEGDDILEGGADGDYLLGGWGNDTVFAESAADDIDAALPPLVSDIFRIDFLSGEDGTDILVGSGRGDYIEGGAHADEILAGAGDDLVYGDGYVLSIDANEQYNVFPITVPAGTFDFDNAGPGDDKLHPSSLYNGPQILTLGTTGVVWPALSAYTDSAAPGGDVIHTGPGNDTVFAGGGDDLAYGETGSDRLEGGAGNDRLFGDEGNDTIDAQDGNDFIAGGTGNDSLFGGAGEDTLLGGDGVDQLNGGTGADLLDAGTGGRLQQYVIGDGDTLVFRGNNLPSLASADGAFPAAVTIRFSEELTPADVVVVSDLPAQWQLTSRAVNDGVIFQGSLAQWSGISGSFSDGTVWNHADFVAHAVTSLDLIWERASTSYGSSSADFLFGTPGSDDFSGGSGDDVYLLRPGGHDSIWDTAGTDAVGLDAVRSQDASVYIVGDDYLLRYPGGDVLLLGQSLQGQGVENIFFLQESSIWQRADLDARAIPLGDSVATLGMEVAQIGEEFTFEFSAETFGQPYTLGTTGYEVSNLEGGALPAWLTFDAQAGSLSGTPGEGDAGVTGILVALRDGDEPVAVTSLVISVEAPAAEEPARVAVFPHLLAPLGPLLGVTRALAGAVVQQPPEEMALMGFAARDTKVAEPLLTDDDALDYVGFGTSSMAGGIDIEQLVGTVDEALALAGLSAIYAQPWEGLMDLGG